MSGGTYVLPAIKGKMGSTGYYQVVMRADELAATVHAAMDFEEFQGSLAHEQMQRRLNEERVEQEIVPYLVSHSDRFFGSLIVLVYKPKLFKFTDLAGLHLGEPRLRAYRPAVSSMGVLEISGGKLFALDGQHRLHALRSVVDARLKKTKHLGIPIEGAYRDQVASDKLSVIFVEFESKEKARRIFNKVNRYAKPTSASTNILTSEDDGYAIITRVLLGLDDPDTFESALQAPLSCLFPSRGNPLIELAKESLTGANPAFTTVRAVYNITRSLCQGTGQADLEEKKVIVRPTNDILRAAYESCAEWWLALRTYFPPFKDEEILGPDFSHLRKADHPWSFAYRPVSQESLFGGLMIAHEASGEDAEALALRAADMPLCLGSRPWVGILAGSNGKMITKLRALAELLVAWYLVGDALGADDVDTLETGFAEVHGRRALPAPLC